MDNSQLDNKANFAITIGRQFGSGGRELGKMLAERFGIDYYDKQLLARGAQKAGLSTELFERTDERMPNLMGSAVSFSMGYGQIPWYNGQAMMSDSIYNSIADVITTLAESAPCVFVGRSADFVLRDSHVPHVNVFIHAPMSERVARILRRNDKATEKEARNLAEKTDKLRASYYNFYTDKRWGDSSGYDITFDSSVLPLEAICDIIALYIRRRFGIEPVRK